MTIVFLSLFIVGLILLFAVILIIKYANLIIKHNRLLKYLYNYLNVITSARYGNLKTKCEDGVDALTIQLSKNTNALLESVFDRNSVIDEYIEKEKQNQNLKQDFVSNLAHDLKVPIIAQDNTYDLFLNGNFGEISPLQVSAIKNLKISNNDLKNLVIDLLDAHKLEYQDFEPNFEKVNLNEIIKEVVEQTKNIMTIQNKELIFTSNFEHAFCFVDPFLIKRVLNNLISNAIHYSKKSSKIEIVLEKSKNNAEIRVIDEGEGIKEKEIKNIFTKYYTTAKKYSKTGVGLGLYIANKIILAHKGKIKAKNNEKKGACFTIILPII